MQPTFDIGTVILSKEPSDPSNLSVGDVVTFKSLNDTTVTHRIIEVVTDEDGSIKYRTKGDNPLNSPDSELLDPERVISVYVFKIPLT
jgi:signal peptidase